MLQEPHKHLRWIFYAFVRVVLYIVLGFNIRRKHLLPQSGPAIVVANHNSHLDTLVLVSLFPLARLNDIRPAAAADYFLKNPPIAWFSQRIVGIIPVTRSGAVRDPLQHCRGALDAGKILILFPEGSRGEPEQMSDFKKGVAHLAAAYPDAPVVPVFMHGLGKALPKNEGLLVPFFCDIFVGESIKAAQEKTGFMAELKRSFDMLAAEGDFQEWK